MTVARTLTALALALTVGACSGNATQQDVCHDARESAKQALEKAVEAQRRLGAVAVETVHPSNYPSPTDTEGFYLSQESQARLDASAKERRQARQHQGEMDQQAQRYTIVVEQNPDCFNVETRARAEEIARRLTD